MAERASTTVLICLGVLCIVTAVGCSSSLFDTVSGAQPEFVPGQGPLLRTQSSQIGGALVEVDGTDLVIEFIGGPDGDVLENPCNTQYELEVDDRSVPMRVTIWELEPSVRPVRVASSGAVLFTCNALGHERELRHAMADGVPTEIVDGSNGDLVPVIQLTNLLEPVALPDGWAIEETGAPAEPASVTTAFSNGASWVFLRTTLVADPASALEQFRSGFPQPHPVERQGDPVAPTVVPVAPSPLDGTVEDITIRDATPALSETTDETRRLRFVHGSYLFELSAGLDVDASVLIAIANGLE